MVLVVKAKKTLLLLLHLGEKAAPAHDIVFVFFVKNHLCVHEIFNHLLTATVLQILRPCCLDAHTLLVMVG